MADEKGIQNAGTTVYRLLEMPSVDGFDRQLDEIFFTSSATKTFASEEDRLVFRERWLGRYLAADRDWFYVAVNGNRLVGYLAGAPDDPARTKRFSDIEYFSQIAADTERFPAHLHVNVSENYRSAGVGTLLIDRFVADLRAAGVRGVHLVTGRNSRNIPFYLRNGFTHRKVIKGTANDSVMLVRRLDESG